MSAPHTPSHRTAIERVAGALERRLAPAQLDRLVLYLEHVASWNRKINLTGAREPLALAEVMLADALVLAAIPDLAGDARLIDVGTGAGAPIVPLLLLRSDLSALCVEPLQKRATFLRMLSARLGLLGRMRIHQARLDPAQPTIGEAFDIATSRATFAPELWLQIGLSLAPAVIVMTAGPAPLPAPAQVALQSSHGYALPLSAAPRRMTFYRRG